jgi:hypothetical protein
MKICSKCGSEHPLTYFNKDRTRSDGLYPQCKDCLRASCRKVYRKYEDKHKALKRRWKADNAERNREINRQWQLDNPEKARQSAYRWRELNPEKARQWARDNPERLREIDRRWKAANKEVMLERGRQYAKKNPHKIRAKCARRRASLLSATPAWADHEMLALIYSECPPGYHVDHIYPLRGRNSCGLHVPLNLQYLPASENCKKSNKPPVVQEAWYNL